MVSLFQEKEKNTMIIDQNILTSFIVCQRKAYLSKDDGKGEKTEKDLEFTAEHSGIKIIARADERVEIEGESLLVIDRQSKNLKERHRIEAAYLSFVLSSLGLGSAVGVKLIEETRKLYPRTERIPALLEEMKRVFGQSEPPEPSFSYACRGCPFYKDCVAVASKTGDISMVNRIGDGRKQALMKAGYVDIETLSKADPEAIAKYTGINSREASRIVLQARAISTSEWMVIKKPEIPDTDSGFFFDVEKSDESLYLFGIVADGVYRHFILNVEENEWEEGWKGFIDLIETHPNAPIYHYDKFDREVVAHFGELSGTDVKDILDRLVDLYAVVTQSIVLPVRFYSLKDVANTLGFRWREEGINGYEAMLVLSAWGKNKDGVTLNKILRYNEDDCRALIVVKDRLRELSE